MAETFPPASGSIYDRTSTVRLKPITVARLFDIPIRLSYGWFPIFVLHLFAVSALYLPRHLHHLHPVEYWILGSAATILLFLSVLGHEIGHALVARAEGIRIRDITLHLFGGLARFERDVTSPGAELRIAIAGPGTSFLYAVLFFVLNQMSIYIFNSRPGALITNYLALSNLILALFNLLPGFPLDGGRVFRALMWHLRGDPWEASRWAVRSGQGIAYTLLALGIYWCLRAETSADIFAGSWAILIGIFLKDAAAQSLSHLRAMQSLQQLTVADVMTDPPTRLRPDLTVQEVVDHILPQCRSLTFPVSPDGRLHGILALKRLESISRDRWPTLRVWDVMQPVNPRLFLFPHTSLVTAHLTLSENGIGSAAVLDDQGFIIGYLTLGDIRKVMR